MSIEISDEILQTARMSESEVLLELVVTLFQREKLTLGQASRLAGLNQWRFQDLLASLDFHETEFA